ncbi:MAG: DEAD/DEAH box helicase [Nanoarchaeota archaeon]|nr:DEAD/DEAH box helicase [Nanoarchaeota archaeon]MBU1269124.1 DEAD/DEAH box helicase [Nanoarchaeota archaeon]MBU1605086.1 DEAD/DEAH box helicase [Nanoarchaeota archaeon]MBU2442767.1 DEAD/DEAH box helicase [Nanoarchaeota archaeon]
MIKNFKPRRYQESIFNTCVQKNCLVVLPTGMGKTGIALLLAAHRLTNYPKSKVVVLAPTKPLVEQHLKTFKKHFEFDDKIILFSGFVKPEKRVLLWEDAKIVVSTPQGLENDILSNKLSLENVSLLIVDEAHRAVKDYSYVFIAKQYHSKAKHPRILGLTASPGSELSKIEDVCQNLFIEDVEIRTENDPDVKPYIQDVDIKWLEVDFPEEFKEIKNSLIASLKTKITTLRTLGYLQGDFSSHTRTSLLSLQAELRGRISSGEKDFEILKSISLLAEVMKIQHALELLESQGLEPLRKYFEKLENQSKTTSVKAVKNLLEDKDFKVARTKLEKLTKEGLDHPKLDLLKKILSEEIQKNKNIKIIIFTQYRASSSRIKDVLDELSISSKVFIGQTTKEDKGLSQKEQKEIIDLFSKGEFNCLISTSVGEEGLDIPQVDLVIFYEPVPSAIRSIQRRGRTGRLDKGKVFVLVTKKTRDEGYRWSAFHKERRMSVNLKKLKEDFKKINLTKEKTQDQKLNLFVEESKTKIVVDYREKGSKVMKTLLEDGIILDLKTLEVGDYLLSDEVVVEYKTKKDFVDSIIDGRLLQQIRDLSTYLKPVIIVEGEEDIFSQRNIHPNAIRGMLSTIAVSYRIPIIFTKNHLDTAATLKIIAQREQDGEKKDFQMHTAKPLSLKEQQEYLISAIPGIGAALARPLLKEFKSPGKVINASEEALRKVKLIGEKKAKKIRELIDSDYHE